MAASPNGVARSDIRTLPILHESSGADSERFWNQEQLPDGVALLVVEPKQRASDAGRALARDRIVKARCRIHSVHDGKPCGFMCRATVPRRAYREVTQVRDTEGCSAQAAVAQRSIRADSDVGPARCSSAWAGTGMEVRGLCEKGAGWSRAPELSRVCCRSFSSLFQLLCHA